jgi:hypothetical protein
VFKKHDPVAVLGLIAALSVGGVQVYQAFKGANLLMLPLRHIHLLVHEPMANKLMLHADLIFFNDTTSNDSEAVKRITAKLSTSFKTIIYKDELLGPLETENQGQLTKVEFRKTGISSPFVIEGGDIAERKILFSPSEEDCINDDCRVGWGRRQSLALRDYFYEGKEDYIEITITAETVSGTIHKVNCNARLEPGDTLDLKDWGVYQIDCREAEHYL